MAHTQKYTFSKDHEPNYFAKHGHVGVDPRAEKKRGFGASAGCRGQPGSELADLHEYVDAGLVQNRRGTNSLRNEQRFEQIQRTV